jgi:hypothetical protein
VRWKGIKLKNKQQIGARQLALLELLKNNKVLKQYEISQALPGFYPFKGNTNFHDSSARFKITKDIRRLNESDDVGEIIISDPSGVRIANDEEKGAYIMAQYEQAFKKIERARKKAKKANVCPENLDIRKRGSA